MLIDVSSPVETSRPSARRARRRMRTPMIQVEIAVKAITISEIASFTVRYLYHAFWRRPRR